MESAGTEEVDAMTPLKLMNRMSPPGLLMDTVMLESVPAHGSSNNAKLNIGESIKIKGSVSPITSRERSISPFMLKVRSKSPITLKSKSLTFKDGSESPLLLTCEIREEMDCVLEEIDGLLTSEDSKTSSKARDIGAQPLRIAELPMLVLHKAGEDTDVSETDNLPPSITEAESDKIPSSEKRNPSVLVPEVITSVVKKRKTKQRRSQNDDIISKRSRSMLHKKLMLRSLHTKRIKQLMVLKEWEFKLNLISTDTVPIMVENDVDLEEPPSNFIYVNEYIPGEGVTIPKDPPIGCECKTGCNYMSMVCCGNQSGANFPYGPLKNVLVPLGTPIYECNKRCRCSLNCINRVVQKGRMVKLSVFRTATGCGWGVKALESIERGTFVCEYVGEVIRNEEAERRGKIYNTEGRTYLFDLHYNEKEQFQYTVDASIFGNVSHFINHSCSPNLAVYAVWINCLDPNLPKLALFATKDIKKGKEVTFDYMCQSLKSATPTPASLAASHTRLCLVDSEASTSTASTFENESIKKMLCKCGSKKCKQYLF